MIRKYEVKTLHYCEPFKTLSDIVLDTTCQPWLSNQNHGVPLNSQLY